MNKKITKEDRILCMIRGLYDEVNALTKKVDALSRKVSPQRQRAYKRRKRIDLTGEKFGWLTVIGPGKDYVTKAGRHRITWECECVCGNKKHIMRHNLTGGNTTSCGRCSHIKHKMSGTPTYKTWDNIIQRCHNKNNDHWEYYGGRGISVCDKWRHSFLAFYEDMGDKPRGMWIERVDNDGDYCRENCKWATPLEQAQNKRPRKDAKIR